MLFIIAPILITIGFSYWYFNVHEAADTAKFVTFKDQALAAKFGNRRIPITTLYEAYFAGQLELKGDMLEVLKKRHEFVSYRFTLVNLHFFLTQLIPDVIGHTKEQDKEQVQEHYDRGNDFFEWFLGPTMVYTSGYLTKDDPNNLEHAQYRKMRRMMTKIHMKPGMTMLDIGCGWGTLCRYASKYYGARTLGVTLSKNQVEFGMAKAKAEGVDDICKLEVRDYRDVPAGTRFDRITCIEMAEHVGVRRFRTFMKQIYELLEDDGLFMIQVVGLRRRWQYQDLVWGLFMNKYVFPGADASTPLGFYIDNLEAAGWELQTLENLSLHYAMTIHIWYKNWLANREQIEATYGKTWWKTFEFFLAWSTIIARCGSAACWQIICNKNLNGIDRYGYMVPEKDQEVTLLNTYETPAPLPASAKNASRPIPNPKEWRYNGGEIPKVYPAM